MTSNLAGSINTAHDSDRPMIQMLTPEGKRVPSGEYDSYAADLTGEDMRGFYRDMVLVRRVDAEGNALQRQGQLGLWAPLLGQEAAQIGMGRALRDQDFVFPTYREHGLAWCRGVDPETLLGMFRGQHHGGWDPQAKRFHTYTIIIGSQALHATGYAMGVKFDGDVATGDTSRDTIAVACMGDGATSQGDVSEALNFAATFHAPVLFFIQNNQFAISEPNSVQTAAPLYKRGTGFGIPGVRVDGNDILAMYSVAKASADSIRAGLGPMLIEAYTYRMGAHTTADDPTKYRSDALTESWRAKDPIDRVRRFLNNGDYADQQFYDDIDAEADELAARIRKACVEMEPPAAEQIFDSVFVEPHPLIEQERAEYAQYLSSFADEGAL